MMKKLLSSIILFTLCVPAFAQQAQSGFNLSNFTFVAPAEISIGRDDNFLVDRATLDQKLLVTSLPASVLPAAPNIWPQPLSDTVYLLKAPRLAFISDSARRQFDVSYQPEIELFQFNRDQNSWNNNAELTYTEFLSRRWVASFGDAYRTSKDPSRTLQNPLLLLPRSQYRENALRGNISFEQSQRTTYTFRYDNDVMTFGEYDPLQRSILDTRMSGASLIYSRMLSRNHRLRLTYSAFSASPLNQQKSGEDHVATQFVAFKQPAHGITAEYRFSMNPKTVFEFSGGGIHTSNGNAATFSLFGDRKVGELWIGGGYSRGLTFLSYTAGNLPSGLGGASFYDVMTFRLRGQPTQKIGVQFNVSTASNTYGTVVNGNTSLMGRSRVDYRLGDHVVAFVNAELYNQNRNDFVQTPISRRRLFIGFEYSFASESEQRTSRLNRDADNIALTEHARLRKKADQE